MQDRIAALIVLLKVESELKQNCDGIDYETPYAYTGKDKVDIPCKVGVEPLPVADDTYDYVYNVAIELSKKTYLSPTLIMDVILKMKDSSSPNDPLEGDSIHLYYLYHPGHAYPDACGPMDTYESLSASQT